MTNIQEQNRKKGGRPPTGRVRKLSKSVTVKFSKPSYLGGWMLSLCLLLRCLMLPIIGGIRISIRFVPKALP